MPWGCSSTGRALEWHSRGKGFDPPHLHQHLGKSNTYCVRFFFYLLMRGYTTTLCATALLSNPCGLALIRLCKHAHFTITALCAYDPPHLHQHLGKSNTYCVRFFFYLLMRGYTTMLCATALLSNPYGLALIRLCKHAHFTITALCAYAPSSPP